MDRLLLITCCLVPLLLTAGCDETTIGEFSGSPSVDFQCLSGETLPLGYLCDGTADCADGSDESSAAGCNVGQSQGTPEGLGEPCNDTQWACWSTSECISTSRVCDGSLDCSDNSDEGGAACQMSCGGSGFDCLDGSGNIGCELLCDGGAPDCPDGSDEIGC